MTDWLQRMPSAAADVECGGEIHQLIWRAGSLHAPAHPDPDLARGLAALGGASCRCLELMDAWDAHASDPQVLVLGPRGGEPSGAGANASQVKRPAAQLRAVATGGGLRQPDEALDDPFLALLSLGGGIPRRLVATAAVALSARTGDPSLANRLHAALYGRVLSTLSRWLGGPLDLVLVVIDPDDEPSLRRDGDGAWLVRLPFEWLYSVWAPGLETVWGRFTLAARSSHPGGWELRVIDPSMTVNTCTLSLQ